VQLYYKDLVSEDVFAAEQDKLKDERRAAQRLEEAATTQLEDVQQALDLALSRVTKPYEVYIEGTELERRMMNRAIFAHIRIGEDSEITGTNPNPHIRRPIRLATRTWPHQLPKKPRKGLAKAIFDLPPPLSTHKSASPATRPSATTGQPAAFAIARANRPTSSADSGPSCPTNSSLM